MEKEKAKLTFREIIFAGLKKFAGEIIGVVLLAVFLWCFPGLRSLFTEHTFTAKIDESQAEVQRELEQHKQEEERLKAELKHTEEALKEAEEARQRAELQLQIDVQSQEEELQRLIQPEVKPSLEIHADDNVWLTVSFGNSQPVFRRTLKRGEVMRWDLEAPARVSFGRPTAAQVVLNGKDLGIVNPNTRRAETYIYNPDGTYRKIPREEATQSLPSSSSKGNKTARIRYIVPSIAKPMDLRIEVTDPSGKREILNKQVKGGENINTTAHYSNECMVSIYLDGQSVWQERHK
jgi:outer membrane lipoprotein-sorting protein